MAGWPPEKNAAFIWSFVLRDADGDLVAGATALDVEFSIDGGVFVNVAGTEVDEEEGFYSCPITAAEMNGDVIGLICKTSTIGVKSAAVLIYTSTRQIDDLAFPVVSGRSIEVESDGMIHADIKEWLAAAPSILSSGNVRGDLRQVNGGSTPASNLGKMFNGDGYGQILVQTTIATLVAQDDFTLTAGSTDDTAYFRCPIIIEDSVSSAQKAVAFISIYTGGTRRVQLENDPGTFVMAVGDIVTILYPSSLFNNAILGPTIDNGAISANKFAAGAIDAAALATDAAEKIADVVQDEPLEDHITEGTTGFSALLSVYAGSHGPGIYVQSNAANVNTVLGTDGTETNPVSTFVASRTLADALGVNLYYLEGNSDITITATHEDWEFIGKGSVADNVFNMGSQNLDRSLFRNLTLEGTQGGTDRIGTIECALQDPGAGTSTFHIFAERCGINDDILVDTSNDNAFISCFSLAVSGVPPIITATGAAGSIIISDWRGRLELKSLSASHIIELDGHGHITFNADCNVNANLDIHGIWDISDLTSGMADLIGMAGLVNMIKINDEADIALVDYDVKALLPAALVNARMDSEVSAAGFTQAAADKVWLSASRTLTAISTAVALPIWQVLETAILTAGSIGLKIKTNLDALISSRSSHTAVNVRTEMDTNSVDLNSLLTLITSARMGALDDWIDAGRLDVLLDLIKVKTDALPSGPAKNVALANFEFLMILSSDDVTPGLGLTVTGEVSIDGAAFTVLTNAITEISEGFYKVDLAAADLNGDVIGLKFNAATANQTSMVFLTT